MDINTLKILAETGAIGLAALSMWIVYKLSSNHINHNTEVLTKNTEAVDDLKDVIRCLKDYLQNGKRTKK